ISLRLDNNTTGQTFGSEDYYYDPASTFTISGSSFTSKSEVWVDASGTNNWSYNTTAPTGSFWISGKTYWVKARAIDNAGNIETVGNTATGNYFIVTLPASQLQVVVDTTTHITAGTSRDIIVRALDNGGSVSVNYTGTVGFSMDGAAGPETSGS